MKKSLKVSSMLVWIIISEIKFQRTRKLKMSVWVSHEFSFFKFNLCVKF